MSLEQKIEIQKNVDVIQAMLFADKIGVKDAVDMIDRAVYGVTRVVAKAGLKYRIINHNAMYDLNSKGLKRNQEEKLNALAVGLYVRAQKGGNYNAGELHLGRDCSTKHHRSGIDAIIVKYGLN